MHALDTRIPPPIVALLVALAMRGAAAIGPTLPLPTTARAAVALLFALSAGAFIVPAVLAFRRARTTVNPVNVAAASSLVTGGIFARTRNPMYVALALLLCAWAVWLASPWAPFGLVLFTAYITRFQILPEERVLRAKFGEAFTAYSARVPRWL